MKIAIHHREESFSEYWIDYCKKKGIDYKIVNVYSNSILESLKDCDIFMWHWSFWHSRDILFAKQLLYSAEKFGKIVYPNLESCLLYDDKIGQKYLSETLELPLVRSYVFYTKEDALKWIEQTQFPKVFKQRGGASSVNVKLANKKKQAKKLVRKAFGKGFRTLDRFVILKDRKNNFLRNKNIDTFIDLVKGVFRVLYPKMHERARAKEKNYIYFQDFIPNCTYDIRVVVVGERAFALKRYTRKDDFRASGSGITEYNPEKINIECVRLAFELNKKLKMQSVAFDFVEVNDKISLIEFSYIWATNSFGKHPGYWDSKLEWHSENFCPADFIVEDLIKVYQDT